MLQELAREGNAMGVKLSELPQINAALSAATAWAKSAASAAAPPSLRATHAKRPALALVCAMGPNYGVLLSCNASATDNPCEAACPGHDHTLCSQTLLLLINIEGLVTGQPSSAGVQSRDRQSPAAALTGPLSWSIG